MEWLNEEMIMVVNFPRVCSSFYSFVGYFAHRTRLTSRKVLSFVSSTWQNIKILRKRKSNEKFYILSILFCHFIFAYISDPSTLKKIKSRVASQLSITTKFSSTFCCLQNYTIVSLYFRLYASWVLSGYITYIWSIFIEHELHLYALWPLGHKNCS